MILFRLLGNLVLIAAWLVWAVHAVTTSMLGLVVGLGLCAAALINDVAPEEVVGPVAFVFLIWNRVGAKYPQDPPRGLMPLFRPRARRSKPMPVPTVTGLNTTADAPTVREALGRLSPALRDVIANPPPRDPA